MTSTFVARESDTQSLAMLRVVWAGMTEGGGVAESTSNYYGAVADAAVPYRRWQPANTRFGRIAEAHGA